MFSPVTNSLFYIQILPLFDYNECNLSLLCIAGLGEEELVVSKEILEEIFNEQEQVGMYRAHLEIEKAKQGRQNEASSSVPNNEVTNEGS